MLFGTGQAASNRLTWGVTCGVTWGIVGGGIVARHRFWSPPNGRLQPRSDLLVTRRRRSLAVKYLRNSADSHDGRLSLISSAILQHPIRDCWSTICGHPMLKPSSLSFLL